MLRSRRYLQNSQRHTLFALVAFAACVASIAWMIVAIIFQSALWAFIGLCAVVITARFMIVEFDEASRLYQDAHEARIRELQESAPAVPLTYTF